LSLLKGRRKAEKKEGSRKMHKKDRHSSRNSETETSESDINPEKSDQESENALDDLPKIQSDNQDVKDWTTEDVISWLSTLSLRGDRTGSEFSDLFMTNSINGRMLLQQTQQSLMTLGINRIKDRKIIAAQIKLLTEMRTIGFFLRDMSEWNVHDVCAWLKHIELKKHKKLFKTNKVTGAVLQSTHTCDGFKSLGVTSTKQAQKLLQMVERWSAPLEIRLRNKSLLPTWGIGDVCEWLRSIGMKEYMALFVQQGINGQALRDLTETSLKEMGITSLGHRKQILRGRRAFLSES
jgi:hypothetical protein